MAVEPIFHITTREAWAQAATAGEYTADSLRDEGFIHCSRQSQYGWVAATRFRGRTGLVLLHIDPSRVPAEIRHENLEGGRELFPHVYGPIPVGAVIAVTPLEAGDATA